MTELLEQPTIDGTEPKTIEKVAIVVSKGSLEGIYPALIMANGARMEGIEADLFFTFFGLDAIRKDRFEKIKVATVGNPGMHMPTWIGAIPGFSALATWMMKRQMEKIDIPPIPEFIELVARFRRPSLRLQGDRGHVRADDGRLRPAGRGDHQRRRVLRKGGWRADHLHLTAGAVRRGLGRMSSTAPTQAESLNHRENPSSQIAAKAREDWPTHACASLTINENTE